MQANEGGLSQLDPDEEAELLKPKEEQTKAKPPKEEKKKKKSAPKPPSEAEVKKAEEVAARNKAREEEKAAARKANEVTPRAALGPLSAPMCRGIAVSRGEGGGGGLCVPSLCRHPFSVRIPPALVRTSHPGAPLTQPKHVRAHRGSE